jgi:hypothetical protein
MSNAFRDPRVSIIVSEVGRDSADGRRVTVVNVIRCANKPFQVLSKFGVRVASRAEQDVC